MPIRGYYDPEGLTPAPLVWSQVELPALQVSIEVGFLLDTGAEITALLHDALVQLPISPQRLRSLPRTAPMAGIGGDVPCYTTRAIISFQDDSRSQPRSFDISINLAPSTRTATLPSLLGRDILNQLRCTLDYTGNEITLTAN